MPTWNIVRMNARGFALRKRWNGMLLWLSIPIALKANRSLWPCISNLLKGCLLCSANGRNEMGDGRVASLGFYRLSAAEDVAFLWGVPCKFRQASLLNIVLYLCCFQYTEKTASADFFGANSYFNDIGQERSSNFHEDMCSLTRTLLICIINFKRDSFKIDSFSIPRSIL